MKNVALLLLLVTGGGVVASSAQDALSDIGDGDYDRHDVTRTMQGQPPSFEVEEDWSQPKEMVIYAAHSLTLSCPALGTPTPSVEWFKNGAVINETTSRRFEEYVMGPFSLTIHNAVRGYDDGNYSCVASNEHGAVTGQFRVTVVGRTVAEMPVIKAGPGNHTVQVGTTLKLYCEVEVVDHASMLLITWLHVHVGANGSFSPDGNESIHVEQLQSCVIGGSCAQQDNAIPGSQISYSDAQILVLENLALSDSGAYVCEVDNGMGVAIATGAVIVLECIEKAAMRTLVVTIASVNGIVIVLAVAVFLALYKRLKRETVCQGLQS